MPVEASADLPAEAASVPSTVPSTEPTEPTVPSTAGSRWRRTVAAHWPFGLALVLALAIRAIVVAAFTPGFVFSDGVLYLGYADHLTPSPQRPVGYSIALSGLQLVSRSVEAISLVQHLLGLVTAVVLYLMLRRWSVGVWAATLATVPVLFDEMQLVLEHAPLSDVVFMLLVVGAVSVLAQRPQPRPGRVAVAGLLVGLAPVVRSVGEPIVLAAVLFCLLAATSWRARARLVAALLAGAVLPIAAYVGWYHHVNGQWALTAGDGLSLYQRSTSFVDCASLRVPAYERTLCPAGPVGRRQDPTYYGFHDPRTVPLLDPPPGTSDDAALRDFAVRAIGQQPGGYARIVLRDVGYGFAWRREDRYGYDTADKWAFERYLDLTPTGYTGPAYADHGGQQLSAHSPWAGFLAGYGRHVYLAGPFVALLGLLGLAGLVVRRRAAAPGLRPVIALCLALGFGLVLVPDLTAEFVWRYQLPVLTMVPAAAALAWTRLRSSRPDQPGTTATPSTD